MWTDQNFEIYANDTLISVGREPFTLSFLTEKNLKLYRQQNKRTGSDSYFAIYTSLNWQQQNIQMRSKVQILTHFSHTEEIVLEILFLNHQDFWKSLNNSLPHLAEEMMDD